MKSNQIAEQQEKDRAELAKFRSGQNKPLSWCNHHDCQLGTCFSLHYPESSVSIPVQDEDVPKLIFNEDFKEQVRKEINKQIDATENWVKLWKHSRK